MFRWYMGSTTTRAATTGFLVLALAFAGCFTPPPPPGGYPPKADLPPFAYEPLNVRNSCFVESVHFYDEYEGKHRGGNESWSRVLEWGNKEGDLKVETGHAVTLFVAKDRLWYYDINFGVLPIDVPLDKRTYVTYVSPKIFAHYPKYRPILARYRDDTPQAPTKEKVKFLFYHANPDVRDATRVASELGRVRPVSVFEFDLKNGDKKEISAAAAFMFGSRVCLYFPRRGTYEALPFAGAVDDLKFINRIVTHLFPGSENVRWQPGGYLLFPNEKAH